jgi:putative transposase
MARPPRVRFPGAIYHVVARGDGGHRIFKDAEDYQHFTQGLTEEVQRSAWELIAYCWLPDSIQLLVRTPSPNLSTGMQHWLSSYTNWHANKNGTTGQLFQGRYKSYLVEDKSYFWPLSRHIHVGPSVGAKPLAKKPEDWAHSSYAGYARKADRKDFVSYDVLYGAWIAEYGVKDPIAAYKKYVEKGVTKTPENPLDESRHGWIVGSEKFAKRMLALSVAGANKKTAKPAKSSSKVTVRDVLAKVAELHKVSPKDYSSFRSQTPGREMAALLCRRYIALTSAELSKAFGLEHGNSSANLVRKALEQEAASPEYRKQIQQIEAKLKAIK